MIERNIVYNKKQFMFITFICEADINENICSHQCTKDKPEFDKHVDKPHQEQCNRLQDNPPGKRERKREKKQIKFSQKSD
jgi:hypothetical protein